MVSWSRDVQPFSVLGSIPPMGSGKVLIPARLEGEARSLLSGPPVGIRHRVVMALFLREIRDLSYDDLAQHVATALLGHPSCM